MSNAEYARRWRIKNPGKHRVIVERCREYQRKYMVEYHKKHPQTRYSEVDICSTTGCGKIVTDYRYDYCDKCRCVAEYRLNRKISKRIRARIALVMAGRQRSAPIKALLGCGMSEFMAYIELGFKNGMGWDNYGKWHLDHIRPCKSFDLGNSWEQEQCFHYSNYQPLWAYYNIVKDKVGYTKV